MTGIAFEVDLAGGGRGRAVRVLAEDDLDRALAPLRIPPGPVVLLFGGAGKVAARHLAQIERFFATSLIPAVAQIGGIVVDGGTDAGVMRMVGTARDDAAGRIRIVGVAPFGKVRVPGSTGSTELAPGHTDLVLVPGDEWGAESAWFHPIADRLSSGSTTTMLVNGGPIALDEIEQSLARRGRVVVVEGTGRAADEVAAAIRRPDGATARVAAIAAAPSIVVVPVTIGPVDLVSELSRNAMGEHRR